MLRFSYYLTPPLAVCGVVSAAAALLLGWTWIEPLLAALMPIFLLFMVTPAIAFSAFVTGGMPCVTFRGAMLVTASWPVYCRALAEFVLRQPEQFVETPKGKVQTPLALIAPQFALCTFLFLAMVAGATWSEPPAVTLLVIGFQLTCHLALVPSLLPGLRRGMRILRPA